MSGCFYDGVSPGQVLFDMNPEEPEAANSLHHRPIDVKGGISFSLLLPVVHYQLLCFADIEMEVVVPAPRCQGSDLLSVGRLVIVGNQADDGHAVMHKQGAQERAEHAALRGTGVESQGGGCGAAYPYNLGSVCQEVQDPITEGGVEPKVSDGDELGGHNGVKC